MVMGKECYPCIFNQILKLVDQHQMGEELGKEVLRTTCHKLGTLPTYFTPPEVAGTIYKKVGKLAGDADLFREQKRESIARAEQLQPLFREIIANSPDPLESALKVSALGNVIDFGVTAQLNWDELRQLEKMEFARWDYTPLKEKISIGGEVLILGDNVGEHLLDQLLVETLLNLGIKKVYYAVRGGPILNDVTLHEVENTPLAKLAEIVDSGVQIPGFHLDYVNPHARQIYRQVEIVISKGMGNYEVLEANPRRDIFFLLKVKCPRVAQTAQAPEGSYILEYRRG